MHLNKNAILTPNHRTTSTPTSVFFNQKINHMNLHLDKNSVNTYAGFSFNTIFLILTSIDSIMSLTKCSMMSMCFMLPW